MKRLISGLVLLALALSLCTGCAPVELQPAGPADSGAATPPADTQKPSGGNAPSMEKPATGGSTSSSTVALWSMTTS